MNLSPIQSEILKAFEQLSQKANFTEYILAKKIRENLKLETKKKAGISLQDLLAVLEVLEENQAYYSLHINSVNDILIKKEAEASQLPLEAKHRRQASEKSMSILTSGDVKFPAPKKDKAKKRSERKSLRVNQNFEDWE